MIKSEYRPTSTAIGATYGLEKRFSNSNIYLKSNYIHTLEQRKNGVKTIPNAADKSHAKLERTDELSLEILKD